MACNAERGLKNYEKSCLPRDTLGEENLKNRPQTQGIDVCGENAQNPIDGSVFDIHRCKMILMTYPRARERDLSSKISFSALTSN